MADLVKSLRQGSLAFYAPTRPSLHFHSFDIDLNLNILSIKRVKKSRKLTNNGLVLGCDDLVSIVGKLEGTLGDFSMKVTLHTRRGFRIHVTRLASTGPISKWLGNAISWVRRAGTAGRYVYAPPGRLAGSTLRTAYCVLRLLYYFLATSGWPGPALLRGVQCRRVSLQNATRKSGL